MCSPDHSTVLKKRLSLRMKPHLPPSVIQGSFGSFSGAAAVTGSILASRLLRPEPWAGVRRCHRPLEGDWARLRHSGEPSNHADLYSLVLPREPGCWCRIEQS